jgi:hypothetical protein
MDEEQWQDLRRELQNQLTKATFNTWLKDAKLLVAPTAETRGTIGLRNEYALDWVQNRLSGTIEATASAIWGFGVAFDYVIWQETPSQQPSPLPPPIEPEPEPPEEPAQEALPGFNWPKEDWTKCPDFFFTHVLPTATPTEFKVVGAIIHNTIGRRDKRGNWQEWWCGVSYKKLGDKTGTNHRTILRTAVEGARAHGWIRRRQSGNTFDYALRFDDQPLDPP